MGKYKLVEEKKANKTPGTPGRKYRFANSSPPTSLDTKSGAPVRVRSAVGAAQLPEDRLATIRQFYPDASPYEDENFVFTDQKTQQPTLYNPPGLDFGDVPSVGPEISEMIGGTVGGGLAALPSIASAPATGGMSLAGIPAGIGLGASGGREIYNLLSQLFGDTIDTRGLLTRGTDAAVTAGVNATGARLGDLAAQGIGKAIGPVKRYAQSLSPGKAVPDANLLRVEPTAGMVTGNKGIQMLESGLTNTPGGAGVMQEAAEKVLTQMDEAFNRVTSGFGRAQTQQGAGARMREAADYAGDRFAATRGQIDDAIDAAFDTKNTPIPVPNVRQYVAELEAAIAKAPSSRGSELNQALKRAKGIIEDSAQTQGAGVPFATIRQIRTALGRDLERPDISGYSPSSEAALRRLYGALSEDVTAGANAQGPKVGRLLKLHDRYVRFNRTQNIPALKKIADAKTDEHAFNIAMNAAKDGGSTLSKLRRNYTPEEWDVVSSSVLHKMGMATPGQQEASAVMEAASTFSPATFLTNWSKLAPESKQALFGGNRYKDLLPELDALVRTTGRIKDAGRMANPSGTARNVIAAFTVLGITPQLVEGDIAGAGGTLLGAVLVPRAAAKLLTSPSFVRWLSQTGTSVMKNPSNWGARLGQLIGIAKVEPEIRDELYQYVSALRDYEKVDNKQPQ
jgi:hypothetical protein